MSWITLKSGQKNTLNKNKFFSDFASANHDKHSIRGIVNANALELVIYGSDIFVFHIDNTNDWRTLSDFDFRFRSAFYPFLES